MATKYRVDCKLANHNRVGVCSEPWYMSEDKQLNVFKEKHLNMDRNDPKRMVFVINEFVDGRYTPIYHHREWLAL